MDISFELERFEWASPERLEVEGQWHGLRRRLPRATLVVEVDGERRRLRALDEESPGSSEKWVAAFPWQGEMPRLPGAELEVGRGIVVDLPRPRRSKARGAAAADPLPASSREEREPVPGREEADRLLAVLSAARTEADEAAARATAAEARAETLRERAEAAEAELAAADVAALRTRAEEAEAALAAADVSALITRAEAAEAQLETLRTRAEHAEGEVETIQARAEGAEADLAAADVPALRARAEEAEAELGTLRAQAEDAETELTALRARADEDGAEPVVAPDLERLRAELETAERERMELRAQLDTTAERLAVAEEQTRQLRTREGAAATADTSDRTQPMPGPRTAAAGGGRFGRPAEDDTDAEPARRSTRRPAERTARRAADAPAAEFSAPPLGERISDWVTSLTGSRSDEPQNGSAAEAKPVVPPTAARSGASRTDRTRSPRMSETRSAQAAGATTRTRRRPDQEQPSWILRVAAVGLLALLMIALLVIVLSLL